jgi:Flp pilus assembly protein protease CpaA
MAEPLKREKENVRLPADGACWTREPIYYRPRRCVPTNACRGSRRRPIIPELTAELVRRLVEVGLLLAIAVVDLRRHRIPNAFLVAGTAFTLAVVLTLHPPSLRSALMNAPGTALAAVPGVTGDAAAIPQALLSVIYTAWSIAPELWLTILGGAVGLGIFLLLYLLARGGLGAGDVKLAGYIGLVLAFPDVLRGLFYGVIAAGLITLSLLLARRVSRRTRIAYGPYLVAGAVLALVFQPAG